MRSWLAGFLLAVSLVSAESATPWRNPVLYLAISSAILIIVTVLVVEFRQFEEKHKRLLFWLVAIPVVLSTLYLAGFVIYKNQASITKGPVHWHADYQVWLCSQRMDLKDPTGLTNKIGSPLFHEHNDDRIHIEGAVMKLSDVNLANFFKVIGGKLTRTEISYPAKDKLHHYKNGDPCPDGSMGTLKVYVNGKLNPNPESYVISPHSYVPPGDCIIFLFDSSSRTTTSQLCESWVAENKRYDYGG